MRSLLLLLIFLSACAEDKTLDDYLADSEVYIEAGDYPAARIELRNAMQIDTNSAGARYLLGTIHFNTDANADAEKELVRAESYGWPGNETRPMLAKALLNQNKFAEVLELSVVEMEPVPAGRLLAVQALAALLADDPEMAEVLFKGAKENAPDDIDVRLLDARMAALRGRLEKVQAQLAALLKEEPHNPDALRLRARILLRQQRLEEARDAFGETIEHATVDFADRTARATINIRLGEFDAVAEDLDEMSVLAPGHPSVNYVAGLMAFHEGRDRDAIANLDRALPVADKYPLVLFYLSLGHLLDGDLERAEKFADTLVELEPDSVQGRKLLALVLLQSKYYDEVEAVLQPLRDLSPSDAGALNMVAHAMLPIDRGDESLFLFRWLGRLFPDEDIAEMSFTQGLVTTSLDAHREPDIQAVLTPPEPFPREDILNIYRLLKAGDNEAAVTAANSLKWRHPSAIAPYNLLADAHLAADQVDEAKEVLGLALKRDPGNPSANIKLAQLARRDGDASAEREYYRSVLAHDRGNLSALLSLAGLEGLEGDNHALEGTMREAIDLNPQALEPRLGLARYYIDSGSPGRVAPLFIDLLEIQQRSPRVVELFSIAEIALGNHDVAYRALLELTGTTGGTAGQFHLMAMAASALGKEDEAAAALEYARELKPRNPVILLASAREREVAGDIEGMAPYVEKLAELSPDAPEVFRMKAIMAAHEGDMSAALAFSQQAHEGAASTATVLQLAEFQRQTDQPELASDTLTVWLEDNPDDVPAMLSLSDQWHAQGDLSAASEQYMKVLELEPDNVLALNNLAWMLREQEPKRALSFIRRATKLMPEEAMVLDTRAVIEHLNGQDVQAARVIQRALNAEPGNPSILYHQAMIFAASGEENKARAQLQKVLQENPESFEGRDEAVALLSSLGEG